MDEILYKKARNTVQALIKDKKFLQEKLSGNIGKPKELWKTIKKIGFTRQKGFHNKHMPQYELAFSPRAIANTFKNHFPNLTSDLVKKFLTLQENLEYLQCANFTRELTSVKKLNLKKLVQCQS